jgi:membrane protein YdbS with pleckstrin-like domain
MGTAIGTFSALASIATLLASSGAGVIWYFFGAAYLFVFTALASTIVILYFLRLTDDPTK